MITQRIDALNINERGLFTAIYGVNRTDEVYVTADLRVNNLYEALYLYLRQEGYITVFYDDKAFSFEQQQLIDFFGFNAPQQNAPASPRRRDFFAGKGPMAKSRDVNRQVNAANGNNLTGNGADDTTGHPSIRVINNSFERVYAVTQSIGFFSSINGMVERDAQRKVAVVFVNPNTLQYTEEEQKMYENILSHIRVNNVKVKIGLKIIALYDFKTPETFSEELKNGSDKFFFRPPFKDLILTDLTPTTDKEGNTKKQVLKTVFFMADPERDEIANMLNRRRITEGLPHIFGNVPWNHIVLRMWQGISTDKKQKDANTLRMMRDFITLPIEDLDQIINNMDTIRAIDKLNAMQGIDNIRKQFDDYRKALKAHRAGEGGGRFRPHMALMGSPGTGKSTVARLFGDILREDGLLPKGHFVKVDVSELIGEYIGSTRPKTRAVCERARGGVLFIDEAYGLMSGDNDHGDVNYGSEAIEVLIQFMEDNDDSLVILAGYTDEIMHLINEGNKGFRRRFNNLGLFYFQDYKPDVLFNISMKMINVPTTEEFRMALKNIIKFKYAYRTKKFGNVGDMENLVNNIVGTYRNSGDTQPLDVSHLPARLRMLIDPDMLDERVIFAELDALVGQEGVKTVVRELFNNCWSERDKMMRINDFEPEKPDLIYVFSGNPGTGKTTIARIMGEVLQKLGVLQSEDANVMTEIKGNDLLTATSEHLKKLFEDNIGKVLFIDEAYMLTQSPRVLADIVANITSKDYENKLCIIMAGYTADMQQMIDVNAGMDRRLQVIQFTDYTNEELFEILARLAENPKTQVRMDRNTCREPAIRYFASLVRDRKFGNAGTAVKLMKYLKKRLNERYRKATKEQRAENDFALRILPEDFPQVEGMNDDADNGRGFDGLDIFDHPAYYSGQIDCAGEDVDAYVANGNDLYASVGLIESRGGSGTAFIISTKNRYVLTASHVVEGENAFTFTLNMKGTKMATQATLLWNNPQHDFAILQLNSLPDGAKCFDFDVNTPREPATYIQIAGFPMGTQVSDSMLLTQGVISNTENGCRITNTRGVSRTFDAIRTQAGATHGSSGGPVMLANNWKVIGILHGGMNEDGFSMNIVSDIRQLFNDNTLNIKI
ncbi:MAG: AAA family ATPase [Bacteroidaceae bacterium]|nr:AAA family ATPase [Bacteroidaceae bacterium]